jgi:hypothetical protein
VATARDVRGKERHSGTWIDANAEEKRFSLSAEWREVLTMLQLSLFIAQTRLFSSAEYHSSASDYPSIDYSSRHLSAFTRAAHVERLLPQAIPASPRADSFLIYFRQGGSSYDNS